MIELENLNNQPIEEILEDAKRQILYLSSEWTNHQESDPGITLMELFVWLKWVQHEYLNRISPKVKNKFLQLLDVEYEKNKGAKALIQVTGLSKNISVPRGTHWKAGKIVFRNLQRQRLVNSQILSVEFNNPEFKGEEEYYKFDGKKAFYMFGSQFKKTYEKLDREFTIKFNKALPRNKNINIYFELYLGEDLERNPIKHEDDFEDMALTEWEYYGIEKGVTGWHKINVVNDDTYKFLFSGVVRFNIKGEMKQYDGVYAIRIKLINQEYDFPPKITGIKLNVFEVTQGDLKCENFILRKKDLYNDNSLIVESHVSIYGKHLVYVKKNGGWVQINNFNFERDIDAGRIYMTINNLNEIIENYDNNDEVLMVVSYNHDLEDKMILGSGTGTSFQNIEFRKNDILYNSLYLMVSEKNNGEDVFSIWKRVDDFFSSDKYDKHFIFDEKREKIIFGDHFSGMAPRKGENNIRLCRLQECMGERSNIREHMINSVDTKNQVLKNARIVQLTPAKGGKDVETMEHAQARAADLFSRCGRAVTMEDYERIVSETPGLILKNIRILPNYKGGKTVTNQNCVTIAVRWNNKIGLDLPESYRKNIINQIDKYRLINTEIEVVGPQYIGLVVSGDIVVNSFYKQGQKLVEKQIKNFVSNLNKEFGQTLHYGDLFGMIDRLDCITYLEKLKVIPKGNYVEKTVSEDIIIPPNGIYYIEKFDLNYIRNSEI